MEAAAADEPQTSPPDQLEVAAGQGPPRNDLTRRDAPLRNQNACDACRARKVKCRFGDGATTCRGCIELCIPCTFNKPRRRRGPPNKHAEALRSSLTLGTPVGSGSSSHAQRPDHLQHARDPASFSASLSPPTGAAVTGSWLALFAPAEVIDRLLDEWFEQIHSVAPVLHRRRFLYRLRRGDADHDKVFCGLVVSVCAATVATLRRANYEPVTIKFCAEFVDRHSLLSRKSMDDEYSVDWCIAKYNLGTAVASIFGMDNVRAYHSASEAAAGVRHLLYYRVASLFIPEQQLLKRLYWLLFAWSCSTDIFGRLPVALIMFDDNLSHMQPLPLTDEQLDPDAYQELTSQAPEASPFHGDTHSYIPGLIALSDLFTVWYRSRTDPPLKLGLAPREVLSVHLATVQQIIDHLPPELRWRGGLSRPHNVTPAHDVQIANIFITSLHVRSNLLQKFCAAEGTGDEHQRIVDDLLEILYHMPRAIFEANGSSIVPKVRDIGAAYLEQVRSGHDSEVWVSDVAKGKLERLLRKLDDLDLWPGSVLEDCLATSPSSLG